MPVTCYQARLLRWSLAALLLLAACPARGQESPVRLGGYLKTFLFQQAVSPGRINRAGSRFQLSARGESGETASFFAAVNFELDSRLLAADGAFKRGADLSVYPVEVYINLSTDQAELRFGQQFIFWGRTTWVNPTDMITSWDYANMSGEIEDYRIAPLAARLNWYIRDELKLDLVWAPLFRPNRLPQTAPSEIGGVPVAEVENHHPRPYPGNGEFGARLSQSVSALALDWSICAYKGFEKFPNVTVRPLFGAAGDSARPSGFSWSNRYDPLWLAGCDFAKSVGSLVFKGEAALKLTDDRAGTDPETRNSRLEYVAGVTYTRSEDFQVGLQYIGKFLLDYDRAAELEALAALRGGPPPFVERRVSSSVSLDPSWRFGSNAGGRLIGIYNLTYRDFFALGFVWWDLADAVKVSLGGVGFGGSRSDTPYARQREFSTLFIECKYSF